MGWVRVAVVLFMVAARSAASPDGVSPLGRDWSLEASGGVQLWDPDGYERMMGKFLTAKSTAFRARLTMYSETGTTEWSTEMGGRAQIAQVTARVRVWSHAGFGARMSWLWGAKGRSRFLGTGSGGEQLEYSNTVELSSLGVLLGGWTGGRLGPGRWFGSLFAGPVRTLATFSETQSWNDTYSYSIFPRSGGDFVVSAVNLVLEGEVELGIAVTRTVTIFAAAGWRQAKADRFMQYTDDPSTFNGPDQLLKPSFWDTFFTGGRYADWDFSGVRAGAGVRIAL